MEGTYFSPFSEMCGIFNRFLRGCGGSRRFYTRKERIEQLEKWKQELLRELEGINELIAELKKQEAA